MNSWLRLLFATGLAWCCASQAAGPSPDGVGMRRIRRAAASLLLAAPFAAFLILGGRKT